MGSIHIKRVYEPASPDDGLRVLVDRLWPRGLTKEKAAVDLWVRDLAPSDELRRWYGHDPEKWEAFQERYARELSEQGEAVQKLLAQIGEGKVTFVYASRETRWNNARALKRFLEDRA